jgi:AraC-like DNA-binding protein
LTQHKKPDRLHGHTAEMSYAIPLIRASAVAPVESWLLAAGLPASAWLEEAGLPRSPSQTPTRLVAFPAFFHFMAEMSERVCPDFGCRTAAPELILQLGIPAMAMRASRTPREALVMIARTMHCHASHVFFRLNDAPGGMIVSEAIPLVAADRLFHAAHQHVAAIIVGMGCFATGALLQAEISLTPHPELGVDYLSPLLGPNLKAGAGRSLKIFLPDDQLDLPFTWTPEPMVGGDGTILQPVSRTCLQSSTRDLVAGMLPDGKASLEQLSLMSRRSRRTLQRQFKNEGTSFIDIIDRVREDLVLGQLAAGSQRVGSIAAKAGFRNPSSLTRAVRRWTDATPRQFRKGIGKEYRGKPD